MFAGCTTEDLKDLLTYLLDSKHSPEDKKKQLVTVVGSPDTAGVSAVKIKSAVTTDGVTSSIEGDFGIQLFCLAHFSGRPDLPDLYHYFETTYPHYHDDARRRDMVAQISAMYRKAITELDCKRLATVAHLERVQAILLTLLSQQVFLKAISEPATDSPLKPFGELTSDPLTKDQQETHQRAMQALYSHITIMGIDAVTQTQAARREQQAVQMAWEDEVSAAHARREPPSEDAKRRYEVEKKRLKHAIKTYRAKQETCKKVC